MHAMASYALPAGALVAAARRDAPALNARLAAAQERLLGAGGDSSSEGGGALQLALCNEACDLDGIACALTYALEVGGDNECAPVLNIGRADLPLRGEAAWLLESIGVDVATLTFADDVDVVALATDARAESSVSVALLDHNSPAAHQEGLAAAVDAVVDHHDDAGRFTAASPRVVAPVGSCATLVAELLLAAADSGGVDHLGGLNGALRLLLLSAVLVDTANLDASVGRATERDAQAATLLCAPFFGEGADGSEDVGEKEEEAAFCAALFGALTEAKYDQSALGVAELLRKDYKQWDAQGGVRVGIAGFGVSLQDAAQKVWAGARVFEHTRTPPCARTDLTPRAQTIRRIADVANPPAHSRAGWPRRGDEGLCRRART